MQRSNIGHYRILEKLGEGGMGEVYKAEDTRLKRLVAIKLLLRRDSLDDEQGRLRFLQEARSASALNHPNIVQVHEFNSHEGEDFIVMEYVQGKTLSRLVRERRLTVDEVLDWGGQMAVALGAAHAAGIVHRDIKPANLIVTGEGVVKILDFGLARLDRLPESIESTMTQGAVTAADMVMGTAPYMSPEQAEGKTVDARSDIFAAGAVLYEMLTGRRAFDGDSTLTILSKVLRGTPPPVRGLRPEVPKALEDVVDHCLRKDAAARYASGKELAAGLAACRQPASTMPRRGVTIAVAAGLIIASVLTGWLYVRNSRARWVRTEALPQIRSLMANGDDFAAFELTRTALGKVPDDPDLQNHWRDVAAPVNLKTSPPGARISYRSYGEARRPWVLLGETPLEGIEIPTSYLQFRVERPGSETIELASFAPVMLNLNMTLKSAGQAPDGMVFVPREASWTVPSSAMALPDFFLDKFEVTNAKFKQFIDAGGYRDAKFWRQPFRQDGRELNFEDAMKLFGDATGRPGPAAWELGVFPKDQGEFPVASVSWFEAAAYCESAGKVLPTEHHWRRAAGSDTFFSTILSFSNFNNKGPARVGSNTGISPFGVYDMAGNVKEWVWNPAGERRGILGGGWSEPSYMFQEADAQDPFTREPLYGFRCAKFTSPVPPEALAPTARSTRDYSKEKPVDDRTFAIYRGMYAYDKTPLETRTELREDSSEDWTRERVSYRTVYGERMTASLYLPKQGKPPYQAVVWAPGGYAGILPSSEAGFRRDDILYLVRTGRAVLCPVYKGTFERRVQPGGPNVWRDVSIQRIKDVFQAIDFLESRREIDAARVAFYGTSFGAYIGELALGLEPRLKAGVLVGGFLLRDPISGESDPLNFAPRIKVPVLMVNGRNDFQWPYEATQLPLFRFLGSPGGDKRHAVFDSGHVPPLQGIMRESLAWLDKYLGPVEPMSAK